MSRSRQAQEAADKKRRDGLRERMLAAGRTRRAIALEMMRRWGYRPRAAWRYAHGWSQDILAARYNAYATTSSRAPMSGTRVGAYERWPDGGERPSIPVLRNLAALLHTDLDQLVDELDLEHTPERDRHALLHMMQLEGGEAPPSTAGHEVPATRDRTYSRREEHDDPDDPAAQQEVVIMAAHEGSERAEDAERRDIGEATLEQLRVDVINLSHAYLTGEPFPLFREMRRVRGRIYSVLDRRLWPRDETELYFLLGALSGLMANAAQDLGYPGAADELIRAGWAYATAIDNRPMMGWLRARAASLAYSYDRPRQARTLAQRGLEYLADGYGAARLHLAQAKASAMLGDVNAARRAITAAQDAAVRTHPDDLHDEIGGEITCPPAKQAYLAGSALVEIPQPAEQHEAISELQRATGLYAQQPASERSYGSEALAHINLARAQLRDGQLDAVDLTAVLALPPDKRIESLPKLLTGVRTELAAPRYRDSQQATDLDERIEAFMHETIVLDLHDLPPGG